MGATRTPGHYSDGPTVVTAFTQDVSSGGTPLTTAPQTIIGPQLDAGMHRRALHIKWTGDQSVTLAILMDLASSGLGLIQVAAITVIAGNVTPQEVVIFKSVVAGLAAGTVLVSGTQPTFATHSAASTEFLNIPADRIEITAVAAATTTVGVLSVDLAESAH